MSERSSDFPFPHTNALIHTSSPYLLQHAHNPVDWFPWGNEALSKASTEHKPLIISIGYSACHWCHVMEHESYSNPDVAAFMNQYFVSIKVDREEHPEVDQIYMHASQLLSGSGGWPLNAFALPDGRPFYVVTYLPPDRWLALLGEIKGLFENQPDAVTEQAEALIEGIRNPGALSPTSSNPHEGLGLQYAALLEKIQPYLDKEAGGLGRAPKFPMPDVWEFLLQYYYLTKDAGALEAVTKTLDSMAAGGIYDQLGGGFCRYATDRLWRVPHFEKMLYDNGQLVSLYAHAYQVTGNLRYETVIRQTLDFVERELSDGGGGFYASLNADSEGQEGKFYTWTEQEIDAALSKDMSRMFKDYYQITPEGNWEQGLNILYAGGQDAGSTSGLVPDKLKTALVTLFRIREKRVRPSLDQKILSSWNALMLKGFLDAYHALGEAHYLQCALRCARFLEQKMMGSDGSLSRTYMRGSATIPGVLEDYGLVAEAFLALYEATFDIHWLTRANALVRYAVAHFRDSESGLFFYASDLSEHLIARKMETEDNVMPSSNAVMAHVLLRLGVYFSQDSYVTEAGAMLSRMEASIPQAVPYYARWARLLGIVQAGALEVAFVGDQAKVLGERLQQHYLPDCIFLGGNTENLPLLEGKGLSGSTMIYVCRNRVCKRPCETVEEALDSIREKVDPAVE